MSLKNALDRANPNTLPDELQTLKLGSLLQGQMPQQLNRAVPGADTAGPTGTAVQAIVLPEGARAASILHAYARAGTVTGYLTPDGGAYAAPASGHIAVQPNGNIAVLAADAITDLDVTYVPMRGDVIELTLPVVSNSMAIPAKYTAVPRGVLKLLSAVSLAGTTLGALHVNKPAATNAATTTVNLDVAKTHVLFSSATDAVTSATVRLMLCTTADLGTLLAAAETSN